MDDYVNQLAELVRSQLEDRTPNIDPKDIDVKSVITTAKKHHMTRMLINPLLQMNVIDEQYARGMILKHHFISASQVNEAKRITEKFEQEHICNQMLKGTRMKEIYPCRELREMSDIDMLVKEEDFPRADKALKELGFTFYEKEEHHDVYQRNGLVILELHRSLYTENIDKTQYDYFLSFARTQKREGYEYSVDFTREDFYVYMIAHMARHFYARGCGIRNLVDIFVFNEKFKGELNRNYISDELAKCGIKQFEKCMFELAYVWLKSGEWNDFYGSLFEYMLKSGIYGREENGIWTKYMRYSKLENGNSVKSLRRVYYFPPVVCIEDDFPWLKKAHFLLPVAWVVRGFKSVFFKKSKMRREYLKTNDIEKASEIQQIYKTLDMNFKKG